MRKKYLAWFLLLQLVFVLGGCSGGNDSVSLSQVSVRSVELLSRETVEKGHTVSLSVTLSSDADRNDLGMSYYLLSKDEATQRIDSYHFGSASIPVVSSGERIYAQSFVFSDDVPPGTYSLLLHVDPLETSLPDDIAYEAPGDVAITVAADGGKPDLVAHSLHAHSSYLVISQDEELGDGDQRDHISMTVDVESVAHDASNVAIMAYVETTAGYEPVRIWNSAGKAFENSLVLSTLDANVLQSVMLDLLVPPEVLARLEGKASTNVKVLIDPLDAIDENENALTLAGRTDDNELVEPVNIYAGAPVASKGDGGLDFQTSYSKGFDNKYFGANLDFLGKAWFGLNGIGASVSGTVPVTVLGHTFDFLGITSDAHYNPILPTDSAFDLDIEFAGITLYSQSGNAGFEWEKTWKIEKNLGYSQTFVIAVVPVEVSAGASGALGIKATVSVNSKFEGTVSPFVDVGAYASAAVNLVVAKGGIRGTLYLIGCSFDTKLGGTIAADAGATQLTGTLDETVGYTLSGPNGGLVIFVKWPKTCWKWHVIPYPCGWNEKDWSLVSWSTYSKTDTLLDRRQSVTVPLQ